MKKDKRLSHPPSSRTMAVFALALGLLAFASGAAPGLAQGCLSSAQTRQAIASGQVISLSQVQSRLRASGYAEISSASVCNSGGQLVYNVLAHTSAGASARLIIDGASGRILSEN